MLSDAGHYSWTGYGSYWWVYNGIWWSCGYDIGLTDIIWCGSGSKWGYLHTVLVELRQWRLVNTSSVMQLLDTFFELGGVSELTLAGSVDILLFARPHSAYLTKELQLMCRGSKHSFISTLQNDSSWKKWKTFNDRAFDHCRMPRIWKSELGYHIAAVSGAESQPLQSCVPHWAYINKDTMLNMTRSATLDLYHLIDWLNKHYLLTSWQGQLHIGL